MEEAKVAAMEAVVKEAVAAKAPEVEELEAVAWTGLAVEAG